MKVGTRVLVVAPWSTYRGKSGFVTQAKPVLMVVLDGERLPISVGDTEVIALVEEPHHAGAE